MGNSNFRVKKQSGYFDTVLYAIYKKSLFLEIGFFDESLHRHEDTEMHGRMISAHKKLFTSDKMIATYYARDNIKKLSKQMFLNGYYSYEVPSNGGLQLRHHVPGIFYGILLSLLSLSLASLFFLKLFLIIVSAYLIIISFSSFKEHEKNIKTILMDVTVVVIGHASYALGYFKGLFKRFLPV